jgi:hypothetical protein
MIICSNLNFWQEIKSGDLLTYSVLLLAFLAYCQSISRDLKSWKSLLISLKSDLKSQGKYWFGGKGYSQETYKDKNSFNPRKIIYPPSLESLPEIIRRGAKELPGVSDEFIDRLSLFNERIIAFNLALDQINKIVSSDPIMSEKLNERLNDLGIKKTEEEVGFKFFQDKIRELKKKEDIFYLAENIRRMNRLVHVELIGNKDNRDKLNFLYHEIKRELVIILDNFDNSKPFILRYRKTILALSFLAFIWIEIFLK